MKRILVVDDMALIRESFVALLRVEGYEAVGASNGAEALAIASQQPPDLILLDIKMPVMDGLTFLKRARESPKLARVPVLAFSEVAEKPQVMEAVKLGVAGYLVKSQASVTDMLGRIKSLVGARSEKQARPVTSGAAKGQPAGDRAEEKGPGGGERAVNPGEAPDPAANLRLLRPVLNRAEVLERVQACEQLKALSPTVSHVLKLTTNARCSVEVVAKAIAQDHAIALKILKLANSAVYTRGEPVDSVHKAVVRIGMERIRQAVLNISVMENFGTAGGAGAIDAMQFWEHAIATGIIAAELAHQCGSREADSAFAMGLLHDVGRIILAEQLGPLYAQVLATSRELDLPLEQVETRMLVINHADVMERVLHAWNFARDLVWPIVNHHLSADAMRGQAPAQLHETARLAIANRLANALLLGSSGNEVVYPIEELCQVIKLPPAVLDRVRGMAREQTDSVKFAMLSTGSAPLWTSRRDSVRDRFKQPFRPIFVSPRPETDAIRYFCEEITTTGEGEPTAIVLHAPTQKDRAAALQALRPVLSRADTQGLPVIVLSLNARVLFSPEELGGRQPWHLATPLSVPRFVATVNQAAEHGATDRRA